MGAARKAVRTASGGDEKPSKQPGGGKPPRQQGPHGGGSNPLFEQCYRGSIVPEAEWPDFVAALRRELPVTFRFAAAHPLAASLAAHLEEEFAGGLGDMSMPLPEGGVCDKDVHGGPTCAGAAPPEGDAACPEVREEGGEQAQPLVRLPWLDSVWRLDLPKVVLRRAPGPKRLHGFLKRCTELGAISRQEAVSMVPVAVLGCHSGLRILDTCASPGMKTLQMIDAAATSPPLAEAERGQGGLSEGESAAAAAVLNSGVVVANELDGRRCCMLAHHVLRVRHPAGLVAHHSAVALPPLGGAFDRVLCDVPCSGDGTIRKAPQLLTGWRPNRSNALHPLQLRIACAGAAQLRVGGRMVYSTCALSPVENEAVVAALLRRAAGALQLVDCEGLLPGLPRRPGLEAWEVRAGSRHCKSAASLQSPAEANERGLSIPTSAWPPAGEAAARAGLPGALRLCWRLYPHLGDGGGFFVALLERTSAPLPPDFLPGTEGEKTAETEVPSGGCEGEELELPEEALCKEALPEAQREASFAAAPASERTAALIEEAREFYGLEALPAGNFLVRTDGDGRNIYLVSNALRDVLSGSPEIKAMVAGVRVFDENRFLKSSACRLRLAQEGARWLAPLMRRRRCHANPAEMLQLLEGEKVLFNSLDEASPLRTSLETMDAQGSAVVSCELVPGAEIHAAAERGAECLSLFVNQHELRELRECLAEFLVRRGG